ncbi:MAG: DoxX family protein [Planctomycetes bacterium]|nr:DoxX family protein [Planctomycetota bacterium]
MSPPASRSAVVGRILSGFAIVFLLFSSLIKFLAPAAARASLAELGFPADLDIALGLVELTCTVLYALPATARIGAILLTGYLGGAVAAHLRQFDPWLTHTLFPVWVGGLAWLGLVLRDPLLRDTLLRPRLRPARSEL